MTTFQNDDALDVIKRNLGEEGLQAVEDGFGGDLIPIENLEEGVKSDVLWLRENKAIPKEVVVSGWIYDVETGKVRSVI